MKKLLSLLLACLMLFTFVGCGKDDTTGNLSRGKFEGDIYKNEYLGFTFTKPESWVYSTDEEIAALLNFSVENLLNDKFKDALEDSLSMFDMMVVDSVSRSNINVVYENLEKSFSTNITISQYIEALKRQLSSTSMNVTFPDETTMVKLGNSNFVRVVCTTVSAGTTMTQVYYLRKIDTYMAAVIVTITSNSYTVEQIEAMFSK